MKKIYKKMIHYLNWGVAWIPFFTITVFISYALHIRFFLERWPISTLDNPESPFLTIHMWVTLIFLATLYFSLPILVILIVLTLLLTQEKNNLLNIFDRMIIYGLGWTSWLLINFYDFTGFFEWFWD